MVIASLLTAPSTDYRNHRSTIYSRPAMEHTGWPPTAGACADSILSFQGAQKEQKGSSQPFILEMNQPRIESMYCTKTARENYGRGQMPDFFT